jgi:hypothetical protein
MEGLQEMRDSRSRPNALRKEYISDEAKAYLADLDAKRKPRSLRRAAKS